MKHKFKVGDRVESIGVEYNGSHGTIIKTDISKNPYYVIFDNEYCLWVRESNLKLIQPTQMKNIKDLGEKHAIQCKTQEEFIEIKRQLSAINLENQYWDKYKENTCIRPCDNTYSGLDYFIDEGYTIVQASDFMPSTVNQRIEQLEKELADLKESVRPKKKIEFVKYLDYKEMVAKDVICEPSRYEHIDKLYTYDNYDVMVAWSYDNKSDQTIYLGHFNDGMK